MSYGMDGWNHDNDLVRRKDVMDSLVKEYNRRFSLGERDGLKLAWIEKAVNDVPAAQQGKTQLPEEAATKGATSDLISRAAAIRVASGYCHPSNIAKELEKLPSAQPERVRGRWNITDAYPHNVYCSECYTRFAQTHWAVWEDGSLPRNFCPNCGADMREKATLEEKAKEGEG